jgi:flagellar protein FlbD
MPQRLGGLLLFLFSEQESLRREPKPRSPLRLLPANADISVGFFQTKDGQMIQLTKINGAGIVVNPDLIEYIEETPDTVITITNGDKVVVKDRMVDIIDKVVRYRRLISAVILAECERKPDRA